jgi:hypothetical protein
MFSVGQKVVLVDDRWPDAARALYTAFPVKGPAYVVRAVLDGVHVDTLMMDCHVKQVPALLLIGVTNPRNNNGKERGFDARRFRAIQEKTERAVKAVEAVA